MRRRFSSASFLVDMSVWFAKSCYTHQRVSTPGLNASAAQVLEYSLHRTHDETGRATNRGIWCAVICRVKPDIPVLLCTRVRQRCSVTHQPSFYGFMDQLLSPGELDARGMCGQRGGWELPQHIDVEPHHCLSLALYYGGMIQRVSFVGSTNEDCHPHPLCNLQNLYAVPP